MLVRNLSCIRYSSHSKKMNFITCKTALASVRCMRYSRSAALRPKIKKQQLQLRSRAPTTATASVAGMPPPPALSAVRRQYEQNYRQTQQLQQAAEDEARAQRMPAGGMAWPPMEADVSVKHINCEDDAMQALSGSHETLTVIEVSMTHCGSSKFIYPTFIELSHQVPNMKFFHILGDKNSRTEALISKLDAVTAGPSFHFFRGGEKIFSFEGSQPEMVRHHVSRLSAPDILPIIKPQMAYQAARS